MSRGRNAERRMHWGLRIGDTIETPDGIHRLLITDLDSNDVNRVKVLRDDGEEGWHDIVSLNFNFISSIEKKMRRLGPPYPSLAQQKALFLLQRGWRLRVSPTENIRLFKSIDGVERYVPLHMLAFDAMRSYDLIRFEGIAGQIVLTDRGSRY